MTKRSGIALAGGVAAAATLLGGTVGARRWLVTR
jgi:hypothetical protein